MSTAAVVTTQPIHPFTHNPERPQHLTAANAGTANGSGNPPASASEKRKPASAKELIAANVKNLIEQLEAGHSDVLTAYLTAMSRFHNYSFGNILEIARQKPTATRVAGMYAWNQLGRRVKKGEKGSRVPLPETKKLELSG